MYVDAADAAVLAAAKAYADTHGGSGGGGGTIATPSVYSETPAGACDGDNTSFTLAHTPLATVLVFKNGVLLAEGDEYSTLGPSITMSEAPLTGDALRAVLSEIVRAQRKQPHSHAHGAGYARRRSQHHLLANCGIHH